MYNCLKEYERLKKLGIELSVTKTTLLDNNKSVVVPESDGFLLTIDRQMPVSFTITAQIQKSNQLVPATVVGRSKDIVPLKPRDYEDKLLDEVMIFEKRVTAEKLFENSTPQRNLLGFTTKVPRNNFRIFSTLDNVFRMHEIAIVTRIIDSRSLYFLTIQETYKSNMYGEDGNIVLPDYPGYAKWQSLQDLIPSMIETNDLLSMSGYTPSISEETLEEVSPHEGRVIFFNLASGQGFAETKLDIDSALVHWSEIDTTERFTHLEKGQLFMYENVRNGRGNTVHLLGITPL